MGADFPCGNENILGDSNRANRYLTPRPNGVVFSQSYLFLILPPLSLFLAATPLLPRLRSLHLTVPGLVRNHTPYGDLHGPAFVGVSVLPALCLRRQILVE